MLPAPPIVSIKNLSLKLNERTIYRDLSLTLPRKKISVIMGPGSAGKSTLLHLLIGHHQGPRVQRSGSIRIFSDSPGKEPQVALMKQKPVLIMHPAIDWLRQCHPRRSELSPVHLRESLHLYLQELGLAEIADRLDQISLEWPPGLRRALLIAGYLLTAPDLLCLDEPFVDLEDDQVEPLLNLIESQRGRQTILLVTHNQRRARRLGDQISLLAGGRIIETAPTEQFFTAPRSEPAQSFIRSGSCYVPFPDTPREHLADEFQDPTPPPTPPRPLASNPPGPLISEPSDEPTRETPPLQPPPPSLGTPSLPPESLLDLSWRTQVPRIDHPAPLVLRRLPYEPEHRGPSEFHWIWPGLLAGVARPGLLRPIDEDLDALERVQIQALVTLNETPIDSAAVEARGISHLHLPIVDMYPPSLEDALYAVSWANEQLRLGRPLAYHCRAGIGRTGTLLAAQIIASFGADQPSALKTIRKVFPRYVQSLEQEQFLSLLADHFETLSSLLPPDHEPA